jgi:hypothetical protein
MATQKGIHATFETECFRCGDEVTVTKGRPDPHTCN